MWTYKEVISTETAIKMSPTCQGWPTWCWFLIKAIGGCRAVGLDNHQFLWFSLTILTFLIMFVMQMMKRYHNKVRVDILLEQELNQKHYEESMDNLLATRNLQQNLEQYDSLFNDMFNKSTSSKLNLKKSNSFGRTPKKTYKEASTDSSSLQSTSFNSQCTQTVTTSPTRRTRIPSPSPTRQYTWTPTERSKLPHLSQFLSSNKTSPVWRN
ncbi:uncharacterized protein Dvir_GJ25765 [Drosophila virilis]|uniref:Uncharacterized protein n=1 Tax=Drosophila virilis TaxID=7244 RepID=A0A0Q9WN54_DROVI|nr:uncharacterized protein Dvir_GJ25765 [Drosophila virilis]